MAQLTVDAFLSEWRSPLPYVTAHTSGSTGAPKPVRLPKKLMLRSASRTNLFFGIGLWSRLHLCLSPDYIAGKMMVVRALTAGCTLTCEEASNNPLADPQMTQGRRISLLAVVPSQLPALLDHPERLRIVDNILVGGSSIPTALRRRLACAPITAWESYGMTETASHVALRPVTADSNLPFTLLPGITCSLSEQGALMLSADDSLTADSCTVITNDCAEVLSQRSFRLLGRLDNVINSGGIKIHPLQVEAECADLLASFQPCYVTSRQDEKWGERVVLATLHPVPDTLLQALRQRLGHIRAPKEVIILPFFDYTSTGKLIRHKL